jgi:DNA-binding transcriptional regulator YdaS (Cro superfamily)
MIYFIRKKTMNSLIKAIDIVGTKAEFARQLNVTPQFVSALVTKKRRFPPALCKRVKQITNGQVLEYELRPDVFDPPEDIRLAG